jgi:hypothetical protein
MRSRLLFAVLPTAFLAAFAVALSALAQSGTPPDSDPPVVSAPAISTPAAPGQTPAASAPPDYAESREPAPVESVEVRPDPAQPGHYLAHVVLGLPSGCARPGGYEVSREGNRFAIAVSIRVPAEPRPCTMIYGTSHDDVPLGALADGQTYTVRANDREITYTPGSPSPAAPSETPAPALTPVRPPAVPATPAASSSQQTGLDAPYRDDRSGPAQLLHSYASALNRKEYARAYSYWRPSAAATELPPFEQFAAGFAETESVRLTLGEIGGDAGAGQLYFAVPVRLDAGTSAGATETFVGCYRLHIGRPQIQAAPPFQPLAIERASVRQLAPGEDPAALLASACDGSGAHRPPPSI